MNAHPLKTVFLDYDTVSNGDLDTTGLRAAAGNLILYEANESKIAERIRKVLSVVPAERVYLTTDCGMKPLPRMIARMKLQALANGAQIVRQELGVRGLVTSASA